VARIGDELERQLRVPREQRRDEHAEHARHEPLRGRDAHGAAHALVATRNAALGGERVLLHAFGVLEDSAAGAREHEAVGAAREQLGAQAPLERGNAPAGGGLSDAELERRRRQGAMPSHLQEEAKIVPIHGVECSRAVRQCMAGKRRRCWCGAAASDKLGPCREGGF
jgi:hypothetical protein